MTCENIVCVNIFAKNKFDSKTIEWENSNHHPRNVLFKCKNKKKTEIFKTKFGIVKKWARMHRMQNDSKINIIEGCLWWIQWNGAYYSQQSQPHFNAVSNSKSAQRQTEYTDNNKKLHRTTEKKNWNILMV